MRDWRVEQIYVDHGRTAKWIVAEYENGQPTHLVAECRDEPTARLIAAAPEYEMATKASKELIDKALPKLNWGASDLDADAIRLLNETPGKVDQALAKAGVK